jgi:hypothetical protein
MSETSAATALADLLARVFEPKTLVNTHSKIGEIMLRTIIATLAVATTLVATATPSNLGKGLSTAPVKAKVHVALVKAAKKVVKTQDCATCDQTTCDNAAPCGTCPLPSCGN